MECAKLQHADWMPVGSFIRPVPAALYCYQVLKVSNGDDEGRARLVCKRFGYDQETQRPVVDGHQSTSYLNNLKPVIDGLWKEQWELNTPRWSCVPLYWRKMHLDEVKRSSNYPAVQLSLF